MWVNFAITLSFNERRGRGFEMLESSLIRFGILHAARAAVRFRLERT